MAVHSGSVLPSGSGNCVGSTLSEIEPIYNICNLNNMCIICIRDGRVVEGSLDGKQLERGFLIGTDDCAEYSEPADMISI